MTRRIVVIGAGGAGLVAAIAARKAGAEVLLLSKTTCRGSATCTAYSAGIFSLACCGLSPEDHYAKTMETGRYLNDGALVKILTEEAEKTLRILADWGVHIKMTKGTASVRKTAPNPIMGGAGFLEELALTAGKEGVKTMDWTVATSLQLEKGRVTGVNVQNWRTGKSESIGAGAVILATGGGGRIYSHTDNPDRITGDGYALALKAGAHFRDMEFVQFYPLGWDEPGFPQWMADLGLVDHMRITDSKGEEFLKKALHDWGYKSGREGNYYARDRSARIVAEKARAGGVFAHFEDLRKGKWQDPDFLYSLVLDTRYFKDVRHPMRMAPVEHYFCGGIEIDGCGRTKVDGLYACGEVSGGVDGANRVGGNALANIVVFGYKAGRAAAGESLDVPDTDVFYEAAEIPCVADNGERPRILRRELQENAWAAIGPIRRGREMEEFLQYLADFRNRKIRIETPADRLLALEMEGLVTTAEEVAKAALKRKESLGTHWREDGKETVQ
jgi:succinate dehydrogenase/fumarate reductase flavoprotein subunit